MVSASRQGYSKKRLFPFSLNKTKKKKSQIQTPAPFSDNIIDFCDIKIHQVPSSPSQYCSAKASLSATLNAELS